MRVLLFFVKVTLATYMISCMSAPSNIAPDVTFAPSVESLRRRELLRSYFEIIIHSIKRFAHDHAISEMDCAVLRYTQTASMTAMQYAYGLHAKSCQAMDVYSEST